MHFKHYSQIADHLWRWKYFTPKEIASRGDGSILIVPHALDKLCNARKIMDEEFYIHSAYRDPLHNARVGGAPLSRHKYGDAFDIGIINHDKHKLYQVCREVGFTGFGFYESFLHVDCGRGRSWGRW